MSIAPAAFNLVCNESYSPVSSAWLIRCPYACECSMSVWETPADGKNQKGFLFPVNIHLSMVMRLVRFPDLSTNAICPTKRAFNDCSFLFTFSWAPSHMFRHPNTLITGFT